MNKKLIVIFLAALILRLIAINQSLWLDEATTARVVQAYNFTEIITEFSITDFHPPLYYLFMKLWTNIFGYSEIVLRFPSILFSLLTGYFVYRIASLFYGFIAGILSAFFFLFNPLIVYYSQEARMYTMTTFFLTLALWSFWGAIATTESNNDSAQAGKTKAIMLFNLFSLLAFVTFYGSIFFIIPLLIYLLIKKEYKYFFVSCLVLSVTFLLLSPLLLKQLTNAKQQLNFVAKWSSVLGLANLKNLFLIPLKFSIGRISFYPKWLYWGISFLWTGVIWFFVIKGGLKNKLLFFLLLSTLGLGFFISFFTPLLQYFRFLYLIPILSILIALPQPSYDRFGRSWIAVAGFLAFTLVYLLNPAFHREDWKSLSERIPGKKIYMIYSSSDPLRYYRKDLQIMDLKKLPAYSLNDREITVIPYSADIHNFDYRHFLEQKRYKLIKQNYFRGVGYETWGKIF